MKDNIPTNNILELLKLAAANGINGHPAPWDPIKQGDIERYVITSPLVHSLHSAACLVVDEHNEIAAKHNADHRCAIAIPHDCQAISASCSALERRSDILGKLMHQAIKGEYPLASNNEWSLRDGWTLVSPKDTEWNETPLFPDPECFYNKAVARIIAIINGETREVTGYKIDQPLDEDDEVIGEVTDDRLKALIALVDQIRLEQLNVIPADMPKRSGDGDEADLQRKFRAWALDQKVSTLNRITNTCERLDALRSLVVDLFWQGVRDTIPAASNEPSLGLRDGWKIIKTESGGGLIEALLRPMILEALLRR